MSVIINGVIYNDRPGGRLIIQYAKLTSIPREIGNLVNLMDLYLDHNDLTSLPKEIGNLVNITYLDLHRNVLTSLPKEIGNLVNLRYLMLTDNLLTSLPKEIGNLVQLHHLSLNSNKLTSLPKEIGNLVQLNNLDLYTNNLTNIPEEIGNLVNLSVLVLTANLLTSIPKEIGNLVNLTYLNSTNNKLTSLPKEIGNLVNLENLNLDRNNLTMIPEEIGNLQNLIILDVSYNKLSSLPREINNIATLRSIICNNNKIRILPPLRQNIHIKSNNNPLYNFERISTLRHVIRKMIDGNKILIPTHESTTEWMKLCNSIDINTPELKQLLIEYFGEHFEINVNTNSATKVQLCNFLKDQGFERECEIIEDESNIEVLKTALVELNITEISVNIQLLTKRQICKFLAEDYSLDQYEHESGCRNDTDLLNNEFNLLRKSDYMIDSHGYCFTRDDFMGMGIRNIKDLNEQKHPFLNVPFTTSFNEDDKRHALELINLIKLHYIPDEVVRARADAQSKQDMLRMASQEFGLITAPYFNYNTFRELSIQQLIGISQELNNISGAILVSQDVIRRFTDLNRIDALILFVNTLNTICRQMQFDKDIVIHNLSETINRVLGLD